MICIIINFQKLTHSPVFCLKKKGVGRRCQLVCGKRVSRGPDTSSILRNNSRVGHHSNLETRKTNEENKYKRRADSEPLSFPLCPTSSQTCTKNIPHPTLCLSAKKKGSLSLTRGPAIREAPGPRGRRGGSRRSQGGGQGRCPPPPAFHWTPECNRRLGTKEGGQGSARSLFGWSGLIWY